MKPFKSFLTINGRAQAAADFYVRTFSGAQITHTLRCGPGGPGPNGSVLTVSLTVNGQDFVILNYGPPDPMSRAITFLVPCENQEEIDRVWNAFLDGGTPYQCGWIADKFGITWQVTPVKLFEMINDSDKEKAARTFQSMQSMVKFDIAALETAHAG